MNNNINNNNNNNINNNNINNNNDYCDVDINNINSIIILYQIDNNNILNNNHIKLIIII